MKPEKLPVKPQVLLLVQDWFDALSVGDTFKSDYAVNFVRRYINGVKPERETIRRYIRQLRQDGLINYTCLYKKSREFEIIPIGEPHSL